MFLLVVVRLSGTGLLVPQALVFLLTLDYRAAPKSKTEKEFLSFTSTVRI